MPSSTVVENNDTLSRIQRDIMENKRRDEELKEQYQHLYNTKHPGYQQDALGAVTSEEDEVDVPQSNGISTNVMNGFIMNKPKPVQVPKSNWTPLLRAISSNSLVPQQNGASSPISSVPNPRWFGSTGGVRGAMQRFINSRGKIAQVKALPINGFSTNPYQSPQSMPDAEATTRITVDPSKRKFVRNNFVPIEERMKREFQEMHSREKELHEHRKSLSSLNLTEIGKDDNDDHADDTDSNHHSSHYDENEYPMSNGMKSARSMGELFMTNQNNGLRDREYESEDELDRYEPASNLGRNKHVAKSLAELCDAPEEELFTPGPQAVIMQFENMIRKNLQNRA